ncbi:MAG: sulfatase [Planctomycetes bacterium]|nr:sulfatase [Planctomycetota bacterium]
MPPRPNILLITVHDLGTRLGCYGETSVQTPALDRLAAHGVRFVNHFATAPYCSPSRGGIITGKYPHVNGLMGLVNLGWNLPPSNLTLDQALGHAGYETLLFGHQHEVKDVAQLGFHHLPDRSVGVRCGPVAAQVAEFLARRREERPFYARVGFGEVHRPYESYPADDPARVRVPPHLKDTPGARQDLAMFHGCIRTMDAAVGRILDALGSSGLAENTLVVFTTDHGIAFPRAKATLYDPGIRTTLLLRGPGIRPGQVASELISNVDVFPSLLDAAGAPVPGDLNGRSFWPLLTGRAYTPRDAIFAEKNTQPWDIKRCIRTARYKYIRNFNEGPLLSLPTDIESSLTRRDMGHDHLRPRPPVELYDLSADPNEQTNLAGRPDYTSVEQDLSTQLQRLLEATHDPILRGPIPRPPDEEQIYRRVWAKLGLPLPKEWDADSRG